MVSCLRIPAALALVLPLACSDESTVGRAATSKAQTAPGDGLLVFTGVSDALGSTVLPAGTRADCGVHGVPLADDVIDVLYGLPYLSAPEFGDAQRKSFPHAATLFFGGCAAGRAERVAVAFCPACREARHAWEQAAAAAGHPEPYTEAQRRERVAAAGAR